MPKCETDPTLLEHVHRFMRENELTKSGAAATLGVDRTTFWRFCNSGKARGDTRALYRDALDKRSINSKLDVADVAVKSGLRLVQARSSLQGSLANHELKLIRRACESVIALLDIYEAQSLGRDN